MTTTTSDVLTGPLTSAASLLAAAALADAAGGAPVSVTVTGADISIQVCSGGGDHTARAATVACYARVLGSPVSCRRRGAHAFIETQAVLAGHPVHAWTITDQDQDEH